MESLGKIPVDIPCIHMNHAHEDQIINNCDHHQHPKEWIITPKITEHGYTKRPPTNLHPPTPSSATIVSAFIIANQTPLPPKET